jgi:hypothetical protein
MSAFGGPNIIDNGLVFYLDAGNIKSYQSGSTTWFDKSGFANNGTLINGPTFNTGSGGSIVFDGVDDVVVGATGSYYIKNSGDPITVNVWVKPGRLVGQYQDIVTNRSGSTSYNWILYQHADDGSIQFHGANQNKSNYVPTIGVWVNVTATVTTSKLYSLYFNGNLYSTLSNFEYGPKVSNRLSIGAGDTPYVEPFLGSIATTQIYSTALSAQEVLQNYNATKSRFGIV